MCVWGGGGGGGDSVLFRTIFSRCLHVVTLDSGSLDFFPTLGLDNVYLGTGRRSMASLTACQTCSPAKDLQPSQASSHHAHRARKRKPSSWHLGS